MTEFLSLMFLSILYVAFIVLFVYLYIFLIKEIRQIASDSGRNVMMWTIISIVMSPFVATVILTGFELCRVIKEIHAEKDGKGKANKANKDVQAEDGGL